MTEPINMIIRSLQNPPDSTSSAEPHRGKRLRRRSSPPRPTSHIASDYTDDNEVLHVSTSSYSGQSFRRRFDVSTETIITAPSTLLSPLPSAMTTSRRVNPAHLAEEIDALTLQKLQLEAKVALTISKYRNLSDKFKEKEEALNTCQAQLAASRAQQNLQSATCVHQRSAEAPQNKLLELFGSYNSDGKVTQRELEGLHAQLSNVTKQLNESRRTLSNREGEFLQAVQKLVSDKQVMEDKVNTLTEQCNKLISSQRKQRTEFAEDDHKLVKDFRKLKSKVEQWCFYAWKLRPGDNCVKFTQFPLGRKRIQFCTSDVRVLIACVWEWLLKCIFGACDRETEVLDMWLGKGSTTRMRELSSIIQENNDKETSEDWRLSTFQLMIDQGEEHDSAVALAFSSDLLQWYWRMLSLDDEAEERDKLITSLGKDITVPALRLCTLFKQRRKPVVLHSPRTLEAALTEWTEQQQIDTATRSGLRIVTVPEMREVDSDKPQRIRECELLVAAELDVVTNRDDHEWHAGSYATKTKNTSGQANRVPGQYLDDSS